MRVQLFTETDYGKYFIYMFDINERFHKKNTSHQCNFKKVALISLPLPQLLKILTTSFMSRRQDIDVRRNLEKLPYDA